MKTEMLTSVTHFAASTCAANGSFLGLVPWYYYLPFDGGNCDIKGGDTGFQVLGADSGFILVALAIAQDLLRIAALVAVGYVIYGGIKYIISQGSPDATKQAQQTIINALIGLVLAMMAAVIVNLIGTQLG